MESEELTGDDAADIMVKMMDTVKKNLAVTDEDYNRVALFIMFAKQIVSMAMALGYATPSSKPKNELTEKDIWDELQIDVQEILEGLKKNKRKAQLDIYNLRFVLDIDNRI